MQVNVQKCGVLQIGDVTSLELRRLNYDLVMCYRIVRGFVDLSFNEFFDFAPLVGTRNNGYKLYVPLARINLRKSVFANRIVNAWNSLPRDVVSSSTVGAFKYRLKLTNLNRFLTVFTQED